MPETPVSGDIAVERAEPDGSPAVPLSPSMVSVDQLVSHPGNVREDLDLTAEFLASVAEVGVRIPLLITPRANGGYLVIEGHRRLAAALKAGQAEVPCVLDAGRAGDQAGQFLDMLVANSSGHRKNFTPVEEAAALFAAHEAGATRTRLRKSTGRKADEIKTALAAGGISADTRAQMTEVGSQLTLDQLALLAEFDGDQDAVGKVLEALRHGYTAEYVAERIRQDRAEAAEHERLISELEAAGVAVTTDLPAEAARLTSLLHGDEDITPDGHAACPGRGAYFPSWNPLNPVHYCISPAEHGHTVRTFGLPGGGGAAAGQVTPPDALPDPPADPDPDPSRKLVIEGNKAWKAAGEVRKRWLSGQLFARRTAPREVAPFVARQLLTMPDPLRQGLAAAHSRLLFNEITRQAADSWLEICDTATAGRLPLLMLGPIVTAYEQSMTEGEGKNTWRTDRWAPCPRRDASRYLTFLASLGYQLSRIEQALADDVPWTGDTPAEPDQADPGAYDPDDDGSRDDAPGEDGGAPEENEHAGHAGSEDDAPPEAA
jgi:ParB family chromosome partitioning protein